MEHITKNTKGRCSIFWKPWRKAISEWRRVIAALIYRETKTLWGEHSLGILWSFLEPISHIVILLMIRTMLGGLHPSEIDPVMFLASGLFPFFLFRNTLSKTMNCISANKALLVFSQIKILDFIFARALLELTSYMTAFFLFTVGLVILDFNITLVSAERVIWGFLLMWFLGIGLGMVLLPIAGKFKVVDDIVSIALKIAYITSGVMFSIERLPSFLQEYLLYNPMLHGVEYIRSGFFFDYGDHIDLGYMGLFIVVSVMFGLIFIQKFKRMILDD